jgi:CheY-like chemotaxis protein
MDVRILDVGQCGFDHRAITSFLQSIVKAQVDAAGTAAEASQLVRQNHYALVLVNRLLDQDGSSGLELIKQLRLNADCPRLMLVSNKPEAQRQAIAAGALPGFGKNSLHKPQTAEHLRAVLEAKEGQEK